MPVVRNPVPLRTAPGKEKIMKKATIKQITGDREFDARRIASYCAEIDKLRNEKTTLSLQQSLRELELKATIVEAASRLIEGMCKMIGGPGF